MHVHGGHTLYNITEKKQSRTYVVKKQLQEIAIHAQVQVFKLLHGYDYVNILNTKLFVDHVRRTRGH